MMKHNKKPEQRTYLQDRFEILIKKQKEGHASFIELTELDEIVNRYAAFREKVLDEMQGVDDPNNGIIQQEILPIVQKQPFNLWSLIKSFINRIYGKNIIAYSRTYTLSF